MPDSARSLALALGLAIAGASLAMPAAAQLVGDWGGGGDWDSGDWGGGDDWDDGGDWDGWDGDAYEPGSLDELLDAYESPSDFASDVDQDFEPDEVLILNPTRASLATARRLGYRASRAQRLAHLNLVLVRLRPPQRIRSSARALAELRKADPQGYYDRNATYRLAGEPCTGLRCYAQRLIGWATPSCAARLRIGMLDSAVDQDNPALAGRRITQRRFHPGAATAAEQDHGTAVAALLVGNPRAGFSGLLPEAELVVADVFWRNGAGEVVSDAARLVTGLDWLAGQGLGVINVSVTGPDGGVLHTAVRRLLRGGAMLVAAAGNLGPQAPPQYPAAYPDVVAVTAVDRHRRVYGKAGRGPHVALAAPGVGIWTVSSGGSGIFREGTSFAAPYVSAALALLRQRSPAAPWKALAQQLHAGAEDLGAPGPDPVFGAGLLRAPACTA